MNPFACSACGHQGCWCVRWLPGPDCALCRDCVAILTAVMEGGVDLPVQLQLPAEMAAAAGVL